jgi:Flp pilus assembly protein TadG
MMKKRNRLGFLRDESGASLVEMALVSPLFLLLTFGVVDFGRAFYLAIEVAGGANAGASYASQNPTDVTGIQTSAQNAAPDVPNLSVPTPTYVCECADGTNSSASCAVIPSCTGGLNYVYSVNVTVTGTYTPLVRWPGIPSSMTLSSSASMRSAGS